MHLQERPPPPAKITSSDRESVKKTSLFLITEDYGRRFFKAQTNSVRVFSRVFSRSFFSDSWYMEPN